jgi:hypothetical protein
MTEIAWLAAVGLLLTLDVFLDQKIRYAHFFFEETDSPVNIGNNIADLKDVAGKRL